MKNNRWKTLFHTFIFAYIYLMLALCVPTNFSVTAPYKTRSTATLITLDGIDPVENLHIVSVLSMKNITYFQRMIYQLSMEMDVEEMTETQKQTTLSEDYLRGQIEKQSAYELALIHGYTLASEKNPSVSIDYEFKGMMVDYRFKKFSHIISIGDLITKINGQSFHNYETMYQTFAQNLNLTLTIIRQGEEITVDLSRETTDIYWAFYPKYTITNATPSYQLPGLDVLSGGPSSGMMQTLAVYISLVDDIDVNEVVVGTGEITNSGNVGKIGGLRQKVFTAIHEGIKYFICPASQYHEVADLNGKGINIYGVNTIEDAVEVLHEIFA